MMSPASEEEFPASHISASSPPELGTAPQQAFSELGVSMRSPFVVSADPEGKVTERDDVCPPNCWTRTCLLEKPRLNKAKPVSYTPSTASEQQKRRSSSIYHPLKPWQTRIIHLEPGIIGQPLVAELLTADLIYFVGIVLKVTEDNILYDALSYSWSYGEFTHSLLLNGLDYSITEAVASALECLRYRETQRYLWVDALCINQLDLEKSTQVRVMLAIYKKASRVVVWIGEQLNLGFDACDFLQQAPSDVKHCKECMPGLHKMYIDIQKVLERPWFRRTWVRQEVFAARKLDVQCGNSTITWERLMDANKRLNQIRLQLQAGGISVDSPGPGIPAPGHSAGNILHQQPRYGRSEARERHR
jgi:hypothetical protein